MRVFVRNYLGVIRNIGEQSILERSREEHIDGGPRTISEWTIGGVERIVERGDTRRRDSELTECEHRVARNASTPEIVLLEVARCFVETNRVEPVMNLVDPVKEVGCSGVPEVRCIRIAW